jgi:hypothetical protein
MSYNKLFFEGKEKEREFRERFKGMVESSYKEDAVGKFDMKLTFKFDFKGLKRKNRSDQATDENIHWIELRNVRGDRGWLYGDADYFVFETNNYYIVVEKFTLQRWIEVKVDKELEGKHIYGLYRRNGRKDLLTIIPTIDLCGLASNMIPK